MQESPFHPRLDSDREDNLDKRLRQISEIILIITCGLFPIFFLPITSLPFDFGKILIFISGIGLSFLVYAMAVLRSGNLSFRLSLPILGLWLIAAATTLSAVVSDDFNDSFLGNVLESQTAMFALLLAVSASVVGVFARSKQSVIKLYSLLIFSAGVLSVWHLSRLIFGEGFLSLGIFTSATSTPIGGWNGLAIFYGLIILLSLLAMRMLPLAKVARIGVIVSTVLSLLMLALINFMVVWYILAAVSALMLLHGLVRNLWQRDERSEGASLTFTALAFLVVAVSIVFAVGGVRLSGFIAEKAGVSFTEVRPSMSATLNIGKAVLSDHPVFGIGPNRFIDAWRMHKDPVINQTIFWSTPFDAGFNHVGTSIIGTGLIGAAAWLFFFVAFIWYGFRFVFRVSSDDRFWQFVGLSSFISAAYFWTMSLLYVPSGSILILSALTTGIFVVAYNKLTSGPAYTISVERHRNYGFVLVAIVIVSMTLFGTATYTVANQAIGVYKFNQAISSIQPGDTVEKLQSGIGSAFEVSNNDVFARQSAFYQWSQMNALLATEQPTATEQQLFQEAASNAIGAAELAISLDPTEPLNHQTLGDIYAMLAFVQVDGAAERALDSYANAKKYDPKNPALSLMAASVHLQTGDNAAARAAAEEAVSLRPNYTEALYFLAQLDINEGNTDAALEKAISVVQLEPQNPARRYQLGLLLASMDRLDEAIAVLEQAVALDPQYANARYFLALGYAEKGRTDDAIEQLTIVRGLSEGNTVVDEVIERLKSGAPLEASEEVVQERDGTNGNVTASDLENDVVTTSNPVAESEEEVAEGAQ